MTIGCRPALEVAEDIAGEFGTTLEQDETGLWCTKDPQDHETIGEMIARYRRADISAFPFSPGTGANGLHLVLSLERRQAEDRAGE